MRVIIEKSSLNNYKINRYKICEIYLIILHQRKKKQEVLLNPHEIWKKRKASINGLLVSMIFNRIQPVESETDMLQETECENVVPFLEIILVLTAIIFLAPYYLSEKN